MGKSCISPEAKQHHEHRQGSTSCDLGVGPLSPLCLELRTLDELQSCGSLGLKGQNFIASDPECATKLKLEAGVPNPDVGNDLVGRIAKSMQNTMLEDTELRLTSIFFGYPRDLIYFQFQLTPGSAFADPNTLADTLKSRDNLRHLSLQNCDFARWNDFIALVTAPPKLCSLSLDGVRWNDTSIYSKDSTLPSAGIQFDHLAIRGGSLEQIRMLSNWVTMARTSRLTSLALTGISNCGALALASSILRSLGQSLRHLKIGTNLTYEQADHIRSYTKGISKYITLEHNIAIETIRIAVREEELDFVAQLLSTINPVSNVGDIEFSVAFTDRQQLKSKSWTSILQAIEDHDVSRITFSYEGGLDFETAADELRRRFEALEEQGRLVIVYGGTLDRYLQSSGS